MSDYCCQGCALGMPDMCDNDPKNWDPADLHPCGHAQIQSGCGGCDPGAIDYEFGGVA